MSNDLKLKKARQMMEAKLFPHMEKPGTESVSEDSEEQMNIIRINIRAKPGEASF